MSRFHADQTVEAWQMAARCNLRWKEYQATAKTRPIISLQPIGSISDGFQRYKGTSEWAAKAPRTQEEWERAWVYLEPIFGDVAPRTVTLEHISAFR